MTRHCSWARPQTSTLTLCANWPGIRDRLGPLSWSWSDPAWGARVADSSGDKRPGGCRGVSAAGIISEAATELGGGGSATRTWPRPVVRMETASTTRSSGPGTAPNASRESVSRCLGVDYGTKRVGLAISDSLGITARPSP